MTTKAPRSMTFNVRPIENAAVDARWHWTVYDDSNGHIIRNGQVMGDRDKAVRAARAAIAMMGGRLVDGGAIW